MNANTIMTVSAFLALIPATVYVLKPRESRDLGFWAVALVALAGPLGWSLVQHQSFLRFLHLMHRKPSVLH